MSRAQDSLSPEQIARARRLLDRRQAVEGGHPVARSFLDRMTSASVDPNAAMQDTVDDLKTPKSHESRD